MKQQTTLTKACKKFAITAAVIFMSGVCAAEELKPIVDDFNDATKTNLGVERQFMNDSIAGGGTSTEQRVQDGVLYFSGKIVPPRGQPGWASSVLPLDALGQPKDASAFEGVKLRIKVIKGNMSISANSTEITNFDYHAAPVFVAADEKYHEVKVPFTSMKRAWSEQTALNSKTIASLSLVAYGLKTDDFAFEIDEVAFY